MKDQYSCICRCPEPSLLLVFCCPHLKEARTKTKFTQNCLSCYLSERICVLEGERTGGRTDRQTGTISKHIGPIWCNWTNLSVKFSPEFYVSFRLYFQALRTIGNTFIVNLAAADLCVTGFINPFSILGTYVRTKDSFCFVQCHNSTPMPSWNSGSAKILDQIPSLKEEHKFFQLIFFFQKTRCRCVKNYCLWMVMKTFCLFSLGSSWEKFNQLVLWFLLSGDQGKQTSCFLYQSSLTICHLAISVLSGRKR